MFRTASRSVVLATLVLSTTAAVAGCSDDEDDATVTVDPLKNAAPVVDQYATNVHANYVEALAAARLLQTAIDAFVTAPSETTLEAAKAAWIAARAPYGPSEVYRFYGGPIDEETGPEGAINAWPLDEAFIDYTRDDAAAGLVNKTDIELTKETIRGENENGGEKNISTGYHAVEFLLWGQDDEDTTTKKPGQRPFTDYVEGGTAANQARRGEYLKVVTEVLIEDLESLVSAWEPGQAYPTAFRADVKGSITKILTGMGSLANAELSGERMTVAFKNKGQEDEHSCFSDNTVADLLGNFVGIRNAYLGTYGTADGPGIDDLVKALDPALDEKMKSELTAGVAALTALEAAPFDFSIAAADGAPEREKVLAAIKAVKATAPTIEAIGAKLGVVFELEKPSEEL